VSTTGQAFPPHHLRARNAATASENKIHDDAVARQHGFAGGLVPGITVFGYLTSPIVQAWGEAWLERGSLTGRFRQPIYDGDDVTVVTTAVSDEGDGSLTADVEAHNPAGAVCAIGQARLTPGAPQPLSLDDFPEASIPDVRLPPTPEAMATIDVLGTVGAGFHASRIDETMALVGDDLPIYRELGVAHPVWLLYFANALLAANVALGPWIHTASAVQNFGLLHDGERVSARGRVAGLSERRGHQVVDLDVLFVADGVRPVMHVRHSAIYRLRTSGHTE
jgi:acyl dehydratase